MTTRYLTVADLKAYCRTEIPTVDDSFYDAAIQAAEAWLDQRCGRQFIVATTATARSYDAPYCSSQLVIHDCTAVTSIVDFGSTLSANQYKLYPLSQVSLTGETVPYTSVMRLGAGYEIDWLMWGQPAQIVVTASWGWVAIPAMIKEACKIKAKEYLMQRDVNFGLVAVSDVGGVGSRENPVVREAVRAYSHPLSIGIA
jgi:hypothetical protein